MKLLLGCGYLGKRVARLWHAQGHQVAVVTRSEQHAEEFSAAGYQALVADVTRPETLGQLPAAETVLFAVGFDRSSGNSIQDVYVGGLRNVLAALPQQETGRFLYISSTGVYGQQDGSLLDEQSATEPRREGGKACLAAERLLAEHPLGQRAVVLRLAGIYGPGRMPLVERIRRGEPIPASAEGYLNLIHVEDAARTVLAAEQQTELPRTYCISDGNPVRRGDFYRYLANLLSAPEPTFESPIATDPTTRRGGDKRIDNRRMREELAVRLAFPSYREALTEIVQQET